MSTEWKSPRSRRHRKCTEPVLTTSCGQGNVVNVWWHVSPEARRAAANLPLQSERGERVANVEALLERLRARVTVVEHEQAEAR